MAGNLNLLRQWRDVSDFLPTLRSETRGDDTTADLDDSVLLDRLRDAFIEFCEDTKVVTARLQIPLECGVCDYPIILDTPEDIIGVGEVRYGDDCHSDCAGSRSWNWGNLHFRLEENSDVLRINRAPVTDPKTLDITVYTAPLREADRVDAILYQRYRNPIVYLTLERLHMMRNMPWSSLTTAQQYRSLYAKREIEVNERRMDRGITNRIIYPPVQMGSMRKRY